MALRTAATTKFGDARAAVPQPVVNLPLQRAPHTRGGGGGAGRAACGHPQDEGARRSQGLRPQGLPAEGDRAGSRWLPALTPVAGGRHGARP